MSDNYFEDELDDEVLEGVEGEDELSEIETEHLVAKINYQKVLADKLYGTRILTTDPEFKSVRWRSPDGEAFLESYLNALNRKAQRLGITPKQPAPQARQGQPKAQQGQPQAQPKQSLERAYRQEMDQLLRIGASADQKIALRQQYRRRGLDI
ncbi:MAG: hypothetical protein QME21_17455 [Anaerolineales bacterium]|nr:hypothetical protein [Anaerolineales bacterium]